jgi:thiosulfate/3-mercaptopyruvate sulfurtransferase
MEVTSGSISSLRSSHELFLPPLPNRPRHRRKDGGKQSGRGIQPKEAAARKTSRSCTGLLLLILGGLRAFAWSAGYPNAQLLIETPELASLLSSPGVRLLDARLPQEYRLGHIPGAVNLPAPATDSLDANRQGYPLPPDWAERLFRGAGIDQTSRVIVYDDEGNRFAARVFYVLEFFGQAHVQLLNGGFKKWQSEGRPIVNEPPTLAPGDFQPRANPTLMATSQWVMQRLKDPAVKLVDARSPAEFLGEKVLGPRGGHIPGAVNIDWTRTIEPGEIKTFLPPARLKELFEGSGVSKKQEVVVYCELGIRGASVYFALRLMGYPRVRLYDGSWMDWSPVTRLPVEK